MSHQRASITEKNIQITSEIQCFEAVHHCLLHQCMCFFSFLFPFILKSHFFFLCCSRHMFVTLHVEAPSAKETGWRMAVSNREEKHYFSCSCTWRQRTITLFSSPDQRARYSRHTQLVKAPFWAVCLQIKQNCTNKCKSTQLLYCVEF